MSQAKCITNDRNRAKAHRGGSCDGTQQNAEECLKNSGSDGNIERVVDECSEQILFDVAMVALLKRRARKCHKSRL